MNCNQYKLKVFMTSEDKTKLWDLAGFYGVTPSVILSHFIGDLISGSFSCGSDERNIATSWIERTYLGVPKPSLLSYLIYNGYNVSSFLKVYNHSSSKANNSTKIINEYLNRREERFSICDIEKEINTCRIWVKEKLATRGRSISNFMNPFE